MESSAHLPLPLFPNIGSPANFSPLCIVGGGRATHVTHSQSPICCTHFMYFLHARTLTSLCSPSQLTSLQSHHLHWLTFHKHKLPCKSTHHMGLLLCVKTFFWRSSAFSLSSFKSKIKSLKGNTSATFSRYRVKFI